MSGYRLPKTLNMDAYMTLTPEIKTQLSVLANEIGVPVGYITIGYATRFTYTDGTEDKEYESVSEYRNAIVASKLKTEKLGAKAIIITSHKLNLPDGTDFTQKEYDRFEKIVKKWAKKAKGVVSQ